MARNRDFPALLPTFQPLQSFCSLFSSVPWALERAAQMPFSGLTSQPSRILSTFPSKVGFVHGVYHGNRKKKKTNTRILGGVTCLALLCAPEDCSQDFSPCPGPALYHWATSADSVLYLWRCCLTNLFRLTLNSLYSQVRLWNCDFPSSASQVSEIKGVCVLPHSALVLSMNFSI